MKWPVLPMKSRMIRPSENLPVDLLKKVSPYGEGDAWKAAAKPPVSTFEAPKLNMAGKSQLFVANTGGVIHKISTIKDTSGICLRRWIFAMNFIKYKGTYGLVLYDHTMFINNLNL